MTRRPVKVQGACAPLDHFQPVADRQRCALTTFSIRDPLCRGDVCARRSARVETLRGSHLTNTQPTAASAGPPHRDESLFCGVIVPSARRALAAACRRDGRRGSGRRTTKKIVLAVRVRIHRSDSGIFEDTIASTTRQHTQASSSTADAALADVVARVRFSVSPRALRLRRFLRPRLVRRPALWRRLREASPLHRRSAPRDELTRMTMFGHLASKRELDPRV
ncbi:hypothetical protein EVAR_83345_1 [Eumeta japonica]|uniref:Uncharacterized protein n=1 Tax=Eumeta variegata TaxID=151549 RepID=A0A4C1VUG9_EUMVA|nr:hypothetical protein EVAR_83345_1 [Eumeta japonica]